ncbi:hypothetical protein LTR37_013656 [Vermiconidia calcicola]|uniref:Uncharacterized protein n=1 Tax=Vermiconidia calcicola TaxID=1690605 RepID=A0ACC3MW65_9PEZI|nr:hypothetical protein LTR37_013656 [Vermiconidia calcicola]
MSVGTWDDYQPRPGDYYLCTKTGTEISTFERYIKTVPDGGKGYQIVFDGVPFQGYMGRLTEDQAKEARKQPFVLFVHQVTASEEDRLALERDVQEASEARRLLSTQWSEHLSRL